MLTEFVFGQRLPPVDMRASASLRQSVDRSSFTLHIETTSAVLDVKFKTQDLTDLLTKHLADAELSFHNDMRRISKRLIVTKSQVPARMRSMCCELLDQGSMLEDIPSLVAFLKSYSGRQGIAKAYIGAYKKNGKTWEFHINEIT